MSERFVYKDGVTFGPRVCDMKTGRWMGVDLVKEMASVIPIDLWITPREDAAVTQSGAETPSEKQKKLLDLADRIDHEELWRVAGMDHDKLTPEQKDRMNAGVALRRYAHLWAPGRWVVFPPVGPVQYSASTLDKAYAMAKKDDDRRVAIQKSETNLGDTPTQEK